MPSEDVEHVKLLFDESAAVHFGGGFFERRVQPWKDPVVIDPGDIRIYAHNRPILAFKEVFHQLFSFASLQIQYLRLVCEIKLNRWRDLGAI